MYLKLLSPKQAKGETLVSSLSINVRSEINNSWFKFFIIIFRMKIYKPFIYFLTG